MYSACLAWMGHGGKDQMSWKATGYFPGREDTKFTGPPSFASSVIQYVTAVRWSPLSEAGVRVFGSGHRFVHFYIPNSNPDSIFLFHFAPFYHGRNTKRLIFEHAVESSSCHQNLLPTPQKCAAQSYNLSAHTSPYTSPSPVLLTYIYTNIPTSRDSHRVTSFCAESGLH